MSNFGTATSTWIVKDRIDDPVRVRAVLKRQIERHLSVPAARHEEIVHLTLPVGPLDPFAWLEAQDTDFKLYWKDRDDETVLAACGAADTCVVDDSDLSHALRPIFRRLRGAPSTARYYGGLRFDVEGTADAMWEPYGRGRFVLPRFELRHQANVATLTCTLLPSIDVERRKDVLAAIEALRFPTKSLRGTLPMPVSRADAPDAQTWKDILHHALDDLRHTPLEKVVLARRTSFAFPRAVPPFLLFKNLVASTENCFHFAFQPEPGTTFVGASPERLVQLQGRRVASEAIAGTRPRSTDAVEDHRLRGELLASDKDRREHAFVVNSIQDTLRRFCATLTADDEPTDIALARSRHLYAGVRGTLRPTVDRLAVVDALHPTPAVGGTPADHALDVIRSVEPFDRGWYAGPIGWIGADAAAFVVAIRSGLIHHRELALYSGAGIVEGSVPEAELDEIEHKIRNFVDVLGLEARPANVKGP